MTAAIAMGHNNPPSEIEGVEDTVSELSKWLTDHPVIQSEEEARAGKLLVDRSRGSLKDLDAERKKRVDPLNGEVKRINNEYTIPKNRLSEALGALMERLTAYAKAEKAKREAEAAERQRLLDEAEAKARAAQAALEEAKEEAKEGIVVDIVAAQGAANQAVLDQERAMREAARAERDTKMKIGGGFNRALGLREKETLILRDWFQAISNMGISESLTEAILKEARAFRKEVGHLPLGVDAITEESL